MRYLRKDVDHFAGFAHAINTFLAGVSLASTHNLQLISMPFRAAHGLDYAFDDLLAYDPRGLVPPLVAPRLEMAGNVSQIGSVPIRLVILNARHSPEAIDTALRAMPDHTLAWVRKGRGAVLSEGRNMTFRTEVRQTALWLRGRFWRAVAAAPPHYRLAPHYRHNRTAGEGGGRGGGGGGAAHRVVICAHLRRGDVTYIDLKGKPSSRWVETATVVDQLRAIGDLLGIQYDRPNVHVHIETEKRGWGDNDTEAIRAVAPRAVRRCPARAHTSHAPCTRPQTLATCHVARSAPATWQEFHLDSSAAATVRAIVRMASSDILLLGGSGFSTWAGIFGCGIKAPR